MDVDSTLYKLCAMEPNMCGEDMILGECKVVLSAKKVLDFNKKLKNLSGDTDKVNQAGLRALREPPPNT